MAPPGTAWIITTKPQSSSQVAWLGPLVGGGTGLAVLILYRKKTAWADIPRKDLNILLSYRGTHSAYRPLVVSFAAEVELVDGR